MSFLFILIFDNNVWQIVKIHVSSFKVKLTNTGYNILVRGTCLLLDSEAVGLITMRQLNYFFAVGDFNFVLYCIIIAPCTSSRLHSNDVYYNVMCIMTKP